MENRAIMQTPMAESYVEDGILYNILTNEHITLAIAEGHTHALRTHFGRLVPYPSLTITSSLRGMDKNARDYLNKISEEAGTVCSAVVIRSAFTKMLANLFLQLSKPAIPTQIFTDTETAVEWIRQIAKP